MQGPQFSSEISVLTGISIAAGAENDTAAPPFAGSSGSKLVLAQGKGAAMGLKLACAIMVIASATCLAVAQAAENLAVTESKLAPEEALQAFVRSYAAPAPVNGKMTRWKAPLCPVATGLPPEAGKLVTDRLKQVAGIVGAPAAKTETCKPNVDIVFTLDPQALLDEVRKTNPILLGYHDPAQQQRLATSDPSGASLVHDPDSGH
jgi:hypothetical protein